MVDTVKKLKESGGRDGQKEKDRTKERKELKYREC
jgi:hypothetical protein